MRKMKHPDPYLLLMYPDPGGPNTCGSCGIRIQIPNIGINRHPSPQKMTGLTHLNAVLVCGNRVSPGFPARHVRSGYCVIWKGGNILWAINQSPGKIWSIKMTCLLQKRSISPLFLPYFKQELNIVRNCTEIRETPTVTHIPTKQKRSSIKMFRLLNYFSVWRKKTLAWWVLCTNYYWQTEFFPLNISFFKSGAVVLWCTPNTGICRNSRYILDLIFLR